MKLKNIIQATLIGVTTLVVTVCTVLIYAGPAYATASKTDVCRGVGLTGDGKGCKDDTSGGPTAHSVVKTIVNILSIVAGIIAVIFVIIGGIKYITSSGEANNIKAAKDTIMYAIVGLIVVALAQVIVRFVLNKITEAPPPTTSTTSTTPNQFVYNNILKY